MLKYWTGVLIAATFFTTAGCGDGASPEPAAAATTPAASTTGASWNLTAIEALPQSVLGVWEADPLTVKQAFGEVGYSEAKEMSKNMMCDIYPYNVTLKGMFGVEQRIKIDQWYSTDHGVLVGKGQVEAQIWRRTSEPTGGAIYMRMNKRRLEVEMLADGELPTWEESYSFVRKD